MIISEEVWKDVKDYEGYYQVSNLGNVKSLDRIIHKKNGSKVFFNGLILSKCISKTGYYSVSLQKVGVISTKTVHQLVAIAFLNHTPDGFNIVVDHHDGNPLNNYVDNLKLITNRENCSKDKKGYSSKYIGVAWVKKDCIWQSQITIKGKEIYLGRFKKELDAAEAYQTKLKQITL